MRTKIISAMVFLTFMGCATIESVNKGYSSIVFADGISKEEAKIIAQDELLLDQEKVNFAVSLPEAEDRGTYWIVVFMNKSVTIFSSRYLTWYLVKIDKQTGEILSSGIAPAGSEIVQK